MTAYIPRCRTSDWSEPPTRSGTAGFTTRTVAAPVRGEIGVTRVADVAVDVVMAVDPIGLEESRDGRGRRDRLRDRQVDERPGPEHDALGRSRSIAGMSSGRGQSRKAIREALAARASRTYASSGASEKNPDGMSSPLRARMSGHSSWYFVTAFFPTAQTSRPKFRAAILNEPL